MIYLDAITQLAENLKGSERVSVTATATGSAVSLSMSRFRPDDYYNNGDCVFLTGANVNQTLKITDFSSAGVMTISGTLAGTIAVGDIALITSNHFPLSELKSALLLAADELGQIPASDTSLTVVEDQAVYTLPTGVTNVYRVEIAQDSSDPYGWVVYQNWVEVNGTIEFDNAPSGYTIRLYYRKALSDDMGVLSSTNLIQTIPASVPLPRLIWTAVYFATNKYLPRLETDDPAVKELNKQAAGLMMSYRHTHPMPIPQRDPRLSRY